MSNINLVGTSLQNGKYLIENELGRGGFGVTYRAVHQTLNQIVVIKTLRWPANDAEKAQQLQQFQAEARRLAQCQHPHIVNVTDFFIEAERPYLVMDFIPGQPLSELIFPNRPLPETTALQYMRQIASALQTVHNQGLLHRDVKPQNIMVNQGNAVLIDFGIARELISGQTQTHTNLVSEGYAPLEQYLPKARRTAAADVYGLAATLYSAVTGQVPVASVLRSHHPLTPPRQLNPKLSPRTEQAILQGMALELAQRPQSMASWLTLLSARGAIKTLSTQPTQVVAPDRPSGHVFHSETGNELSSAATAVAPQKQNSQPSKRPGPGLLGTLIKTTISLTVLGLLGGLGFAGYRLYQAAQQTFNDLQEKTADLPEVSIPEVSLPEVTLPNLEEILPDLSTTPTDIEITEPDVPTPAAQPETLPPLILSNSGNPSTATPGSGNIVPVPGFAPGTAATAVINRLGEPTRRSVSPSATTAVYELDPNRATVAYIYDASGRTIQQTEAVFAPAYDRLIMRTALTGMLNGRSTRAIETGLDQVRTGEIERYPFEQNGLRGSIERNNNGFIHIHVR
ncbi:serine threonine protein kinase [Leptolyngbya sp. Heron Island J]|uniref:serine/threonine-protein kinase n=1 Tax=Leptolyngbya sp. Heron Island J TaxID=1385935 RepID=UPI0003B9444F|nr:serine/threonine-protein kinase [Leptolyngbya sp. Heron Island J]ESA33313.1 serine threonine protein kinase [Leptolyngbya sp. Heron Island J]